MQSAGILDDIHMFIMFKLASTRQYARYVQNVQTSHINSSCCMINEFFFKKTVNDRNLSISLFSPMCQLGCGSEDSQQPRFGEDQWEDLGK